MTTATPLTYPCTHTATEAETARDVQYHLCSAQAGEPCRWAKRYDGLPNPAFHAERLEAAFAGNLQSTLDTETFREAILDTGLV